MDNNQIELYPCRFCGSIPLVTYYVALCVNCQHSVGLPPCNNDVKKFWQARNEKHNPFMENNNDNCAK